jgi:hypothetical protein
MAKKQRRGFAAMAPEKQRQIAVVGGQRAQQHGAHRWTAEEAKVRARAGGLARAEKARQQRAAGADASGAGPPTEADTTMATGERRRGGEMIADLVSADLAVLQRRGVSKIDLTIPLFTGRDSLRGVYEAVLLLALQLRTLIEEEAVTRTSRVQESKVAGVASVAMADVSGASVATLMVHRNVGGRCVFCDEAFPCAFARGMVGR